jgi:hypothetical protein
MYSDELLALATLLKEALGIDHDLAGRLSLRPASKSLLKQRQRYRGLVDQLAWELDRALAGYLAGIRGAAGPAVCTTGQPSLCACTAFRRAGRRGRAR